MQKISDIDIVQQSLEQAVAQIRHLNVQVEIVGNWLWLRGETKPYAQDLKEAGFCWSKHKARWFFKPAGLPKKARYGTPLPMADIRAHYGSVPLEIDSR